MRIRIRSPSGVSTINLSTSATVSDLQSSITKETSIPAFDIKFGYPPKPLDLTQFDPSIKLSDTGLKLDGEQLIVIVRDIQSEISSSLKGTTPAKSEAASLPGSKAAQVVPTKSAPIPSEPYNQPLSLTRKPTSKDMKDPPEIPVPTHDATMVLRIMPDDNSCMFRALGSAVLGDSLDSMHELRSAVAQGIQADPELYSEAVLQRNPDDYCRWISNADSWGGGIELSILSQHFDVEVCSINVQDLRVDRFNEGKPRRIILVYSGIHYDTIALSPSEPPHRKADLGPEFDIKMFSSYDDVILEKARELCKVLKERHYYTDTAGFGIKCDVCGWQGKGEVAAQQHAEETSHTAFSEAK
ncbi:ubiquitin-specific protease otu1 [Coniosporium apollinis]|uniref:Ubiquitin thioesterase OTU n=2 Tax=Coniosporium TaxID=2810619 RepID=A0ABQ9NK00_9PEZI|nr:ubiquitin-specific protease otu1 [Cladosporium sp. JES 115]KAJ9659773.1 ubiquitin-specific protease otu1 [Coniosporium apollinis]